MTSATTAPAVLDPATLTAIRQALASAQSGRIGAACETAEQALANGGDEGALNALLGMLRSQAGEPTAAIRHLEIAHRAKPGDFRIAANLASALAAEGDLARAISVATPELAFSDPTLQLARIRGYVAQMIGDPAAAVEAYEHVVAATPDDWESWNNLGNARNALGDLDESIAALRHAARLNPNAGPTRLNLSRALRVAGNFGEAEQQLRAMADDFPADPKPWADLHDLLKVQGGNDEAVLAAIERAVERDQGNVEYLLALARQQLAVLQIDPSEKTFRAVIGLDPANAEAFVGLASVCEHLRPDDLAAIAGQAERHGIEPGAQNFIRAFEHRRAKRPVEGLAAIANVPEDFESARRWDFLGQFEEQLGNHDAAFAAFARMNEIQSEDPSNPLQLAANLRQYLRTCLDKTTADWLGSWQALPMEPDRPSPVFLVGFPRSGTTLLDTMLMGHPDVEVMEERPILSEVGKKFGDFAGIAKLDEGEVRLAQAHYFEVAGKYAELRNGSLLIDKSPLLLSGVPLIHRLFPNARFILALRHPADVLLSCFVSNFRLNPAMSNFLRLDTAAEFYDLVFASWERARALMPIQVHTITYEKMVVDSETELRPLIEWLGIGWQDEVLDHRRTAATRGIIPTVSYAQVTEPIYQRSAGRWLNYRKHLEPSLPVLEPWIEKFGYSI